MLDKERQLVIYYINMKRYFKLLVLGIGLMGMFSCGGEDEPIVDSGNNPDENPVEPPGGFTPDQTYEEDRKLLNLVQKESFSYMWDYGHPVSGLAYERYPGEGVVTIGGSGFGIASIVVACERGWITRQEAVARMLKITDFLKNKSERTKLHGAFPHWMNGETGKTVQFSEGDDGADIVETAFLFEGLLIARQYFAGTGDEEIIRNNITTMWEEMEWDWFTQGQNVLYWHWSPNTGFNKNMQITGFNECMMTYILAVSSPTHPVSRAVYDAWTSTSGYMQRVHNGYTIEAAVDYCGPLFFTHYSFIGLDPRKIADEFVTKGYFIRNTTHTLIKQINILKKVGDLRPRMQQMAIQPVRPKTMWERLRLLQHCRQCLILRIIRCRYCGICIRTKTNIGGSTGRSMHIAIAVTGCLRISIWRSISYRLYV